MCSDTRCTDGVTWCAGCRGFGVLRPGGKRYRKIENVSPAAVPHEVCNGTGLLPCGCVPLDACTLATLTQRPVAGAA